MNIKRICLDCNNEYSKKDVPNLVCGHFLCSDCYVLKKTADKNCCCSICFKKLKRKMR